MEEIKLPKRSNLIYKEIEEFEDYEYSNCIAYEMAIRNKEAITLKIEIDKLLANMNKDYFLIKELNNQLLTKYWIRHIFEEDILNYPIKGTFKKLEIRKKLHNEVNPDITIKHYLPIDKNYKKLKSKDCCNEDIEKTFMLNNKRIVISKTYKKLIIPKFLYQKTDIQINLNLPKDELRAYISKIKDYYDEDNFSERGLSLIFLSIFSGENNDSDKSDNKQINKRLIADKFFIYDYITARQEQIKKDNELKFQEYEEQLQEIKNNPYVTPKDRKIQQQELKKEFEENTNTRINELFEDIEDFTPATAKRYYYDIKPFIDDLKYKELITGTIN